MWNDYQEQLLITWAEQASGHSILHHEAMQYYNKRNMVLSVPTSFFGYIAGITVLFSDFNGENSGILRGAIAVSSILAGLLNNFQQVFSFKELGEQHKVSSMDFFSFVRSICSELSLEPKMREKPQEYITKKRTEFDKMIKRSPHIPQSIIAHFREKYKDVDAHKPQMIGIITTILPYKTFRNNLKKRYSIGESNIDKKDGTNSQVSSIESALASLHETFMREKEKNNALRKNSDYLLEVANSERTSVKLAKDKQIQRKSKLAQLAKESQTKNKETIITFDVETAHGDSDDKLSDESYSDDDTIATTDENFDDAIDDTNGLPSFFKSTNFLTLNNYVIPEDSKNEA